jgi:AAA-like domain/TIR domain
MDASNGKTQQWSKVFIDTGIHWGANWVKEIQEALQRSDYLLVLLSPEAAVSEMVAEEVALARELAQQRDGTPIILPIRVRFPYTKPLPYHLSASLRTIHQESWSGPEDSSRLVGRLLATVATQNGWPVALPSVTPSGGAEDSAPRPHFDPRDLIIPGGSLDIDSRFYILREADEEVFSAVHKPRAMVTVRGPRQTGKTSLIMRVYAAVQGVESQLRTAFIDFQALPYADLQSLGTIWRATAVQIAEQLQLQGQKTIAWESGSGYDRNFSRFLDHCAFDDNDTPLLLCLDEVDRVFNSPIKAEFFPSVRAFYNRSALDPTWKRVRWLLATSSEPSFFITDLTQSPFNIGLRVELNAFTPAEVAEFAGRHGLSLDRDTLDKIMDYIGGHPYLVHLMLYHLARRPESRDQLFDAPTAGRGVFRDHLHRYLIQLQREEELAATMKGIVNGQDSKDVRVVNRLEAAGLIRRDHNQRVVPLCRLS